MKKQRLSDANSEELTKEFVKLMPGLPGTVKWLFKKLNRFDYRSPTTFIAELEAKVAKCVPVIYEQDVSVLRRLCRLFSNQSIREEMRSSLDSVIKSTKKEAAKDPRYSLLLKLMSEADKTVPLSSIIVSMRHGDPRETLRLQCAPYDLLEHAEREYGEARATFVLRALGETYETLYRPYLITLWHLSFLREGKVAPVQIPTTGNLVNDTYRRLADYPGLVEPDAGWMRNSAIHNPRKYILDKDAVEMWDKSVLPPRTIPVSELLAMVNRMYQISGVTIQRVAQLYMFRKLFIEMGLLDGFAEAFPLLLSANESELQRVEAKFTAKGEEMFRPLANFFGQHTPPPVS